MLEPVAKTYNPNSKPVGEKQVLTTDKRDVRAVWFLAVNTTVLAVAIVLSRLL
jgi:hypothetical protein